MDNNLYLDILSQGMDNVKDFSHQILGQLEPAQLLVLSRLFQNLALEQLKIK